MKQKWILLALIHYETIVITSPSIAGITYIDDNGKRPRNVHECDPFYWHPLHLPEDCANMYERLIRANLPELPPKRFMLVGQEDEKDEKYEEDEDGEEDEESYDTDLQSSDSDETSDDEYSIERVKHSRERVKHSRERVKHRRKRVKHRRKRVKHSRERVKYSRETVEYYPETYTSQSTQAPIEKLLELISIDIAKNPSQPKIQILPNLGPVALYNQEVSRKSEKMIKDVSTAYAKYGQRKFADQYGYGGKSDKQLFIWDSRKNSTKPVTPTPLEPKPVVVQNDRLTRTKTVKDGIVTIIETLRPRRRRSAWYILGL